MQQSALLMFDAARELSNEPFIITSGYRTPAHNTNVGGVEDSAHVGGWAGDISINSYSQGQKIAKALYSVGFRRIGIASGFIHADNDPTKAPAIWGYPKGTPAPYHPKDL